MVVTNSVAGVVRVVTSSAATSATMLSAKPAYVEISAARSSPASSMQVVSIRVQQRSCNDLVKVQSLLRCASCYCFLFLQNNGILIL